MKPFFSYEIKANDLNTALAYLNIQMENANVLMAEREYSISLRSIRFITHLFDGKPIVGSWRTFVFDVSRISV